MRALQSGSRLLLLLLAIILALLECAIGAFLGLPVSGLRQQSWPPFPSRGRGPPPRTAKESSSSGGEGSISSWGGSSADRSKQRSMNEKARRQAKRAKRDVGPAPRHDRKSAPEEFLMILTELRREAGQVVEYHQSLEDEDDEQRDIPEVITLVRSVATESWEQARASTEALCRSPLMDVMLARLLITSATQAGEPSLALDILAGMRERRVFPDAYILALVLKAVASDMGWLPVIQAIKSEMTALSGGLPQDISRRHHGFLRALASAVDRGKFFSSSFLVDALLQFSMVDILTLKVALKFYRFSKTPARALPWITAAKAFQLVYDEDVAFEVGRVYKSLGLWREAIALLDELLSEGSRVAVGDRHVGVVFSTCHEAGEWQECLYLLGRLQKAGVVLGRIPCLILLRLLLENRKVEQARGVLAWMTVSNNPLDEELARLVLLSLAKTGPVESSHDFLTKLMPTTGVRPDATCFTSVLRACVNFGDPDRALVVYEYMRSQQQPQATDVLSCVTVMEALTDAQRYDEALSLYARARAEGMRPDIKCHTQVLRLVVLAERWDLFQSYVQEAVRQARQDKAFSLDLQFFATVINACAEAGRPDEALAVLQSIGSYGLTPNIVCYGAAAKACMSRVRWREALGLLDEAKRNGVAPDAPLYRAVLRCCWQARQWQSVVRLCADMHMLGFHVDDHTYLQLMDTLARAGQTELAFNTMQQMVASGVSPSEPIVSAFLRGHYDKGEYGQAWERFDQLRGGRGGRALLRVGPSALQDLMGVCVRREDWQEVLDLAKRWSSLPEEARGGVASSGQLPLLARAHLTRAHAELDQWRQAEEGLNAMQRDFPRGDATVARVLVHTYTGLLHLCARRILPRQAQALLSRMRAAGLPIDADCFHYALDATAQTGQTKEVWSLFDDMRATLQGSAPRLESFTIMLELCAREGGRSEEALQLMEQLEAAGLQPDIICLNAAMNAVREAAFLEGDADRTARLRAQLAKWRARETMHTYNSEIAVMAIQRSLREGASTALRLIREMRANGIPRDVDSFNMALEVCSRANDVTAAIQVLDELQASDLQPNVFTHLTAAVVFARNGHDERALELLSHLQSLNESAAVLTGSSFEDYYTMLWPQTFKQVYKALLLLAEGGGERRCQVIVRTMTFLRQQFESAFDAEGLAEQLATRRLCAGYVNSARLTGGALDSDMLLEPVSEPAMAPAQGEPDKRSPERAASMMTRIL